MSIENFINNVIDKDYTSADNVFADMMQARMQDALDQQKVVVAGQMFGEEEDDIDDITDEEIEDSFEEEDDIDDVDQADESEES